MKKTALSESVISEKMSMWQL